MVDEAASDGRPAELVNTAAQIFISVMPELTTPAGKAQLAQMSATIAGWDNPFDENLPEGHDAPR
jgi:hypothetical protein